MVSVSACIKINYFIHPKTKKIMVEYNFKYYCRNFNPPAGYNRKT